MDASKKHQLGLSEIFSKLAQVFGQSNTALWTAK